MFGIIKLKRGEFRYNKIFNYFIDLGIECIDLFSERELRRAYFFIELGKVKICLFFLFLDISIIIKFNCIFKWY